MSPPSPPPGPRWPALLQLAAWWTRPVSYLERGRARYGKRFTIRLPASPPLVVLSDPDEIKAVYTASPELLHPGEGAGILEPIVGSSSVILLDGDVHLAQRKLMLPAFHGERMARLTGLIAEAAEREVAGWPGDRPLVLYPRMQALTLEVILRAVFGLEPGPRLEALRGRLTRILDFGARPGSLVPGLQRRFGGLGPWDGFLKLREETDHLIFELIDERRADRGRDGDDILSILLEARHEDGSPLAAAELRDELMTLLVAGHETTASELAWAFERLARERRVLATLVDEIDRDESQEYLLATVRETLRRRPVLPGTQPRLAKDTFATEAWTYPAGVALQGNAYLVHHDPEIYPDPYAFHPERFLERDPGTYTWIPFGGGRRRCLGASFAIEEMKVVLTTVLRERALSAVRGAPETARRRAIAVTPRRGARASVRPRAARQAVAAR